MPGRTVHTRWSRRGPTRPVTDPAGGGRGGSLVAGLRLSVSMLTVVPWHPRRVDRSASAVAMAAAPAVGAGIGALLAGVLLALTAAGAPPLVAAAVATTVGVLITRGLHVDGLADTVDALGSYRSGADALQIMKKPDIGPFGVAAVVLVLLLQTAALAALTRTGWSVVVALAAGRLAATFACRRGVPAARPDGLGALVSGTVATPVAAGLAFAVAVGAGWAVPDRPWHGPLAVAAALVVVAVLLRHAVRRFGGITGDVIGAAVETGTTVALLALTLR